MSELKTTILGDLSSVRALRERGVRRFFTLALEAAAFTGLGLLLTGRWKSSEAGVLAIMLSVGALTRRLKELLDENRALIWGGASVSPRRVNGLTATSVLSIFAGVMLAFLVAAMILGAEDTEAKFGFLLQIAHIRDDTILDRRFGTFPDLVAHNGSVLFFAMLLSFIYRSFGLQLVLTWNACTWALVLVELTQRGLQTSSLPALLLVPRVIAAVLPHLLVEAAAYVVGGLAALFASQASVRYSIKDRRARRVLAAVARLIAAAVLLLLAGALVEAYWPSFVLRGLR